MDTGNWVRDRTAWLTTAGVIVVTLIMYAALFLPDKTVSWLIEEERPIEGLGAISLLVASIISVRYWLLSRRTGAPRWRTWALLGLALLFFVGFGEEISWGQRIIGWGTPSSLASANAQDETNIHNLKVLEGSLNADNVFALFWLVMGVLVPLLALHTRTRERLVRLVPVFPQPLVAAFVGNQLLIWGFERLFTDHPDLFHSTKFHVTYCLFEVKESGLELSFAAAMALLYLHARRTAGRSEDALAGP